MDPQRFQLVKRLLGEALEQPNGQRTSWLRSACGTDATLFAEICDLMHGPEAGSTHFAARARTTPEPQQESLEGVRLGPWRLIRALGQGGMGTVWLAARDDEMFDMNAAVKLVSRERCYPQLIGRFRRERQILAHLKHPHIAGLYDGGTTKEGRPYLVMEYVDGETVDRWAMRNDVDREARVELVCRLCSAVAYAHGLGIIHRDIKCSNIMVTRTGHVKLMDFGIARLAEGAPIHVHLSYSGEMLMTPEYAAPELLDGSQATAQSDIYSLGLVLLQMLTGVRSMDRAVILQKLQCKETNIEITDIYGEPLPAPLTGVLRRALAIDFHHRYSSAEAMSKALTNYLTWFRGNHPKDQESSPLVSIVHRNASNETQKALDDATAEALTNLRRLALAWQEAGYHEDHLPRGQMLQQWQQLLGDFGRKEDGLARRFLEAGEAAWRAAVQQGEKVQRERVATRKIARQARATGVLCALALLVIVLLLAVIQREAMAINEMNAYLDDVAQWDEKHQLSPSLPTTRDLLNEGTYQMINHFDSKPNIQSRLQLMLAQAYRYQGDDVTARTLLQGAIKTYRESFQYKPLADTLLALARTEIKAGNLVQAKANAREALLLARVHLNIEDIASKASLLAQIHFKLNEYNEARQLFTEALDLFERNDDHRSQAADCMAQLALLHRAEGRNREAEPLMQRALRERVDLYGNRHRVVALTWTQLSAISDSLGKYEQAEAYRQRARSYQHLRGARNLEMAKNLNRLACQLMDEGSDQRAISMFQESLHIQERILGTQHPEVEKTRRLMESLSNQ